MSTDLSSKVIIKSVVITGGELFNKGAQSMVYTLVGQVKQRFPGATCTLLSTRDFVRPDSEKQRYRFDILPWDIRLQLRCFPFLRLLISPKHYSLAVEQQALKRWQDADLVLDISGYALASVFPKLRVLNYLLNLRMAKNADKAQVLLPQSFGPFEFDGIFGWYTKRQLTKLMSFPCCVYAREQQSQKWLSAYREDIKLSPDMVVQHLAPSNDLIYAQGKAPPSVDLPAVPSVAIVPNAKTFIHNQHNDLYQVYQKLIEFLRAKGLRVYLLRHSHEDKRICETIKAQFINDDDVVALTEDYDAHQLSSIIRQMRCVIASRYHAVVHAYREHVPALVLGWAVKYVELMQHFDQADLSFDIRESIDQDKLLALLQELLDSLPERKEQIAKGLVQLHQHSVFNDLFDSAVQDSMSSN